MNNRNKIEPLNSALQQAGIDSLEFSSDTITATELTGVAIARAHILSPQSALSGLASNLPEIVGQCGEEPLTLCTRPGEWLFVSETLMPGKLIQHARSMKGLEDAAIYNNTDGLAVFRISGHGTPWLLSKLSGLDYLEGKSSGQHCARTKMGCIAVIVHFHGAGPEEPVFDLFLDRSYAGYLWNLLRESAPHADDLVQAHGFAA